MIKYYLRTMQLVGIWISLRLLLIPLLVLELKRLFVKVLNHDLNLLSDMIIWCKKVEKRVRQLSVIDNKGNDSKIKYQRGGS